MSKQLFVLSCPIDTFSGYGARSRDIAKAIIKSGKYDLKILSQRWGSTPTGFLKSTNLEHKQILDCIMNNNTLPKKPDIWAQVTVPNEFQAVGTYNIGITAGIETTICDVSWIAGVNRMDMTLVSSQHAKSVFESTTFDRIENEKVVEVIKVNKPIEVLFEGVDTDIYQSAVIQQTDVSEILDTIDETFCFLFVGHWLQGEIGQDRKDVGMLVKTFLETFKDKPKKPALILKTNGATYSTLDKDEILTKVGAIKSAVKGDLPKIYVIHGELSDEEMNELYNHQRIKAMVSFTKGEGYGRPLLEFSTSSKPVIAPNYSGHLDFLSTNSILLDGKINQLHPSAVVPNMLLAESGWFTVDYKAAGETLENVYKKYANLLGAAKKQSYLSKTEFSLNKMQELLLTKLDKAPKFVPLQLPKLIKI